MRKAYLLALLVLLLMLVQILANLLGFLLPIQDFIKNNNNDLEADLSFSFVYTYSGSQIAYFCFGEKNPIWAGLENDNIFYP